MLTKWLDHIMLVTRIAGSGVVQKWQWPVEIQERIVMSNTNASEPGVLMEKADSKQHSVTSIFESSGTHYTCKYDH